MVDLQNKQQQQQTNKTNSELITRVCGYMPTVGLNLEVWPIL